MTDKQIIIDGCDVSGCKCFYINDSHPELQECINPYCKGLCKENPNCYYKQLKQAEQRIVDLNKTIQAKEQECEELKELNTRLDNQREVYWKEYQKLKAENEELKKKIESCICSTDCYNYQEAAKYKQTLKETKEVLQFYNNSTIRVDKGNGFFEIEVPKGNFSKFIYYYDTNPAKKALQKISEVMDETNTDNPV